MVLMCFAGPGKVRSIWSNLRPGISPKRSWTNAGPGLSGEHSFVSYYKVLRKWVTKFTVEGGFFWVSAEFSLAEAGREHVGEVPSWVARLPEASVSYAAANRRSICLANHRSPHRCRCASAISPNSQIPPTLSPRAYAKGLPMYLASAHEKRSPLTYDQPAPPIFLAALPRAP